MNAVDVLVVGAGPAGLTTAAGLARAGIRVLVVEKHSGTSIFPKAAGVRPRTMEILRSWGLRPELGAHVLDQWGYMAGGDEDRLADLNEAVRDPGVRAIVTTRGGAGAHRIADGIDFEALRVDPKPLVGLTRADSSGRLTVPRARP